MNWKSFTLDTGLGFLEGNFSLQTFTSRDGLIEFVRAYGKVHAPYLIYYHDLTEDQRKQWIDEALAELLAKKHGDWFLAKDVVRADTAFFGRMPGASDIVWKKGEIQFETTDPTVPKPIPAKGTGYLLKNGYWTVTEPNGLHTRNGIRHDLNRGADGISRPYHSLGFGTFKFVS